MANRPSASNATPAVVPHDTVAPIAAEQAPTKVRIARLITRERQGAGLLLGKAWMAPGERTNVWSFETDDSAVGPGDHHYGPVDEFYYVLSGTFRLSWARGAGAAGENGSAEFGPGDAVHLPPGWRYQLENIGTEPGAFIYGMAPPPQ